MLEGGCFCGKIRYQIDAEEPLAVNCHCSMCRRTSGAPFVVWLVVPKADFHYLSEDIPVTSQALPMYPVAA